MQDLFRRPSGIYVLRISIPSQLRQVFRKREVVLSTGTRELAIAKLVAGPQAAQWRQRIFDARRLIALTNTNSMNYQEILKINDGHPVLLGTGHLDLQQASVACGLNQTDLLRAAGNGDLSLFIRGAGIRGYLLSLSDLELDDPEIGEAGGYVAPLERQMPENATAHISQSLLKISAPDLPSVTTAFLTSDDPVEVVSFALPDQPLKVFVPNALIRIKLGDLEVRASEVEHLRKSLASKIAPERLKEAKALQRAALHTAAAKTGKRSSELLSTALNAYVETSVRQKIYREGEIARIKNGCALLIELAGDVPLEKIDADRLRHFRDRKLSQVPANENKIRLMHGSDSVTSSIKAVVGTGWPIMSASERNKRMSWISAWFSWLHGQKWIAENPATALQGEDVQTKAERSKNKSKVRADEARDAFTPDDLAKIFSASWFKTGRGELSRNSTYRTFMPLYYWLPLLGLYAGGGRVNELSQLHLSDIQKTKTGQWYIDFNQEADDQDLKNSTSKRQVPVHPTLIRLGFDKWLSALRDAGYTRLFPELKHSTEKGYGKTSTKWFTNYMASLGIPRNGKKTFHSFRHTFANALPEDTPVRVSRQMTGHARGKDTHDKTYRKDVEPEVASQYVSRLAITLPEIAVFDIDAGLVAIQDALDRKNGGRGAEEDLGKK